MKTEINLTFNYGFSWFRQGEYSVKGYIQYNGNLYEKEILVNLLKQFKSRDDLIYLLNSCSGSFTIILPIGSDLFVAVDLIRTFPIFYRIEGDCFSITDDVRSLQRGKKLSGLAKQELLTTGFVTGNDTLYSNIHQLLGGTLLCYDQNNIDIFTYYSISTHKFNIKNFNELQLSLTALLQDIFKDLITSLDNKTVVLPLSGGMDSRLIAVMLKILGYEKVICFTYGKKSSFEVQKSQKVAAILGYEWHFIEYNEKVIGDFTQEDNFYKLVNFQSNGTATLHLQDYFAIKELFKQEVISTGDIIIPGHSGDFIAGSHIGFEAFLKTISKSFIVNKIFKKHFLLRKSAYNIFKNKIKSQIGESKNFTENENWNFKERQSKYIVNSIRTYEFFGLQHRLPFFDYRIVDFFKYLHPKYRINKKLYDTVLNELFNNQNVKFESHSGILSFIIKALRKELSQLFISEKIRARKRRVNKRQDLNNFKLINEQLIESLKKNSILNKDIDVHSHISVITTFWLICYLEGDIKNLPA